MKHVISFSGGRTSAYMTLEVLKIHPDAEVIYMDTGAEHPKTYEFIRNVSSILPRPITCLRCLPSDKFRGAPSFEVVSVDDIHHDLAGWIRMLRKYGNPYQGGPFCTDRMKTKPFEKYCEKKYGKGNYQRWIGIRADEPKRLKPADGFRYLADISDFEKQDIIDFWLDMPFDLGIDEHLGNCVFCIKKSDLKLALACKDEPELARIFIDTISEHNKKESSSDMYRGRRSLGDIIQMFPQSRDEIAARVRGAKSFDTGSCSESCEVFVIEESL